MRSAGRSKPGAAILPLVIFITAAAGCSPLRGAPSAPEPLALGLGRLFAMQLTDRLAYLTYAGKAEAEQLPSAARLFRAAARSRTLQARRTALLIKELGGVPEASPSHARVKDTLDNVSAALENEEIERKLLEQLGVRAAAEGQGRAAALLQAHHRANAAFIKQLADLSMQQGRLEVVQYSLCPECGLILINARSPKACPACGQREKKIQTLK